MNCTVLQARQVTPLSPFPFTSLPRCSSCINVNFDRAGSFPSLMKLEPSVRMSDIVEAIKKEPGEILKHETLLEMPVMTYGNVKVDMSRNKGGYVMTPRSDDLENLENSSDEQAISTKTKASRSRAGVSGATRTQRDEIEKMEESDSSEASELHEEVEEARTKLYLAQF